MFSRVLSSPFSNPRKGFGFPISRRFYFVPEVTYNCVMMVKVHPLEKDLFTYQPLMFSKFCRELNRL